MAKNLMITTPKGTLQYPRLNTPDTKFSPEGDYKTNLVCPADECAALLATIKAAHEKSVADALKEKQAKDPKVKKVKVQEPPFTENEEDGTVTFKFKMKAQGKTKDGKVFPMKPQLFDAKKKPLDAEAVIGGGSIGRVAAEINPYFNASIGAGVSLRLQAVQVLELRSFGGSADSFGFEMEAEETEEDEIPFDSNERAPDSGDF